MSNTHVGKIGRLPKNIRDDLGRRIEDGEQGKELVKWLNGLPRVKEVLIPSDIYLKDQCQQKKWQIGLKK